MKNRYKVSYFIGIIFLGIFFIGSWNQEISPSGHNTILSSFSQVASAAGDTGGLVPCGHGSDPANRCTLCDLFKGVDRIIKWGRNILVAVALTAIAIGGIMYIVSAGNEQLMESAKNVIKQALAGVVIVLGAWLIINTVMWLVVVKGDMGVGAGNWWNFSCDPGTVNTTLLEQTVNDAFDNMLDDSANSSNTTIDTSNDANENDPANSSNTTTDTSNDANEVCPDGQHSVTVIDIATLESNLECLPN